jgi:hypothetical protein
MNIETERILKSSGKIYKSGDCVKLTTKIYGEVICFIKKIKKNKMLVTAIIENNQYVKMQFVYEQIGEIEFY